MRTLRVRYYTNPDAIGWRGFLEPMSGRWIAFLGLDGRLAVFRRRDPKTGAVPLAMPPP